jgi:hypothetical protein
MNREILTSRDVKSGRSPKVLGEETASVGKDQYLDRLMKYIPAEIVALYILVLGIMGSLENGDAMVIHWIVFAIFCILTFFYLRNVLHVSKFQQCIIAVIAYVVWVFALGGPFESLSWYKPIYGQIFLPIFTFAIAMVEPEK